MNEMLPQYRAIRKATLDLTAPLTPEDMVVQAMPDASPTKWHLAHTTWFFESFILVPNHPGYQVFDPAFGFLFNSYYNTIGERQPRVLRGLLTRPRLEEILAYRNHVDEAMETFLQDSSGPAATLVELGLHHEQQHQELILSDIKYLFGSQPLKPAYVPKPPHTPAPMPSLEWIAFDEGIRIIGHDENSFAFDNEGPRHKVFLGAFELASRPVTSGEYLEFILDEGYKRPELWLADGWDTVRANDWKAPLYWRKSEAGWKVFTLQGEQELDPGKSVCHLSHFEADAYARWADARLPTEFEWEAASGHPGLSRLLTGVWEWTASAYLPYPGFHIAEGAVGEYNGKFMSGQMVLRGGSVATPQGHIRPTYRDFFPPAARWQFSGLRLAR